MIKLNDEAIDKIADGIASRMRGEWQIKDGWETGTPGHEKFWNDYIKRIDPHEKRYKEIIRKLLQKQAKEVFENIREYPNSYMMWTFDRAKSFRELIEAEAKFITELYKQEGQKAIDLALKLAREQKGYKAEVGIDFDIENPRAIEELLKQTRRFPAGVIGTTEEDIREAIAAGIKEGETLDQIANRVESKLGPAHLLGRAELIARTEGIYAANAGAELGYIQSGVVEGKQWLIAWDERTCDICLDMEGMTAPIGEPTWEKEGLDITGVQGRYGLTFDYTEGEMPHPPIHPRCRCTIIPVLRTISVESPQMDRINEFEASHGGEYTETSFSVDGEGNVIFEKEGGRGFVEFKQWEYDKITSTKNVIFSHSHPGNCSFSGADISWLADMDITGEMRIAAKNYNYSLKMTKKTIMPRSRAEVLRIHNEIGKKYHAQYKGMFNDKIDFFRDQGMLVPEAKEAAAEVISELHIKAVNKEFVKMFDLKFKRTKKL